MFKFTILLLSQFLFLSLNAMDASLRTVVKRKHDDIVRADASSGSYSLPQDTQLPIKSKGGESQLQKIARGSGDEKEQERPRLASIVVRVNNRSEKAEKEVSEITPDHHFIYDAYTERRGEPKMLEIMCCRCDRWVMNYQKDGPGALLRCYLDRIHAPRDLKERQYARFDVRKFPRLRCNSCDSIIGIPMIYALENRPAYKMFKNAFYF